MPEFQPCPIWGGGTNTSPTGEYIEIDSRRTGGKYRMTGSAVAIFKSRRTDELAAKLTTWIVDRHRFGEAVPQINSDVLDDVKARPRLSVAEQLDRFFEYLIYEKIRADFMLHIHGI